VLVAMLLAAGCMGRPDSIPPLVPTSCPPTGNATPYIIINPIGNHYVGDVFEIKGSTNLDVDSKIILDLWQPRPLELAPGSNVTEAPSYHLSGTSGYLTIKKGSCGTNTWYYPVDLSGYPPSLGYGVEVRENSKKIKNSTDFYLYSDRINVVNGWMV